MPNYVYFLLAVAALIVGYIIYGGIVTKVFGVQPSRATPAQTHADGVDYVEMPVWKVWLVQLLNIAGVGPVFGPILGALWGPSALLWIVIGTIFAGAVHDYMAGMLSIRYGGANVPTFVGYNLGNAAKPPSLRSWPAAWPMKSWASPCFTAAWWPKASSVWSGPLWA